MNKTKNKLAISEGWVIHVYDKNRRLKLTLDRSHIWAFGWGLGVSLILMIIFSALQGDSRKPLESSPNATDSSATRKTDLQERPDANTNPDGLFHLGID